MKKEIIKVNDVVAELIKEHGFEVEIIGNKIIPNFKESVKIETWIYETYSNHGVQSRLDIGVTIKDGEEIYESFGDIGKDLEDVINNNINNFINSSLHVFIDAFNDTDKYKFVIKEKWQIADNEFNAFIGNFYIKSGPNLEIEIPENLCDTIENSIHKYNLDEEYYFVRFFYAHNQNKTIATEFMINNISLGEEEKQLKELNWVKSEEYYSVRNFLILKRIEK